jgi:hypothetical protein
VEFLLVDCEDCHIWAAEQARVIECADFDYYCGHSARARDKVGSAVGAELSRDRPLEIASDELFGGALDVRKARNGHRDEDVGRSAGDILTLAAVTLGLHHRLAFRNVAYRTAVASAFQFHVFLPFPSAVRFPPDTIVGQTRNDDLG